ncbi:DUF2971 domain-containing protein [Aeromonas caviae]
MQRIPPVLLYGGVAISNIGEKMRTLYKYTTYRNLDFLRDPTLRISIPKQLNDPFESHISENFMSYILNIHSSTNMKDFLWAVPIVTNRKIEEFGIVSFSETSRNSLMWAHYADEHNGLCIGMDDDVLSSLNENNSSPEYSALFPIKVDYDSLRFDSLEKGVGVIQTIFKLLTRKSDEWIYEKEHRAIVPLEWCDEIKIKDINTMEVQYTLNAINHIYGALNPTGTTIKNNLIETKDGKYYTFNHEAIRVVMENKNFIFIKHISPSKIKSIHLGCRFPEKIKDEIVEQISSPDHPLNHIDLYKYKLIDNNRFEMSEFQIYSKSEGIIT